MTADPFKAYLASLPAPSDPPPFDEGIWAPGEKEAAHAAVAADRQARHDAEDDAEPADRRDWHRRIG